MPSFRIPTLFHPRRSFHRLRSFHLTPAETAAQIKRPEPLNTIPELPPSMEEVGEKAEKVQVLPRNVQNPLGGGAITKLAFVVSLIFILTITLAFLGPDDSNEYFELELNKIASASPGIVLIGESVDVDIDEPSVTIRWSIFGCGESFVLPGSTGVHGSKLCGLPSLPLYLFVDNNPLPAATYDPSQIPFNRNTGARQSIQNLVQFDSDHALDVHEASLYPFDDYTLTSSVRAVSFANQTLPIRKLASIDITSSFNIALSDSETYSTSSDGVESPSRDLVMKVNRPAIARIFAILLFGVAWVLTHVAVGLVFVARRLKDVKPILKHLASTAVILVAIPQLRNSMPDAPGLDGVLIDTIGYFPQMIITAFSVISLLLLFIGIEIDAIKSVHLPTHHVLTPPPSPPPSYPSSPASSPIRTHFRPPPSPTAQSSSMEIAQYDMYRLLKQMKGQYVFPPVSIMTHHSKSSTTDTIAHRRSKTMSKLMEAGEMPKSRFDID